MKQLNNVLLSILLLATTSLTIAGDMGTEIDIENAYIREVPPGVSTSASFLTIINNSDNKITLTNATSDVAKNIELHEHTHTNGMMEMRQVSEVAIPAKGETELKPGGYHIMLIGLTRKIKSGDIVNINLEFDDGSKKEINAEVKKVMNSMKM